MKNLRFIFAALFLLAISCKKPIPAEVITPEPEKEKQCVVSFAPLFTRKGPAQYKFLYNADSVLIKLFKVQDEDTSVTVPAYTFTYDDSGKLIKVTEDFDFGGYYNILYNNNQVSGIEFYGFEGNQDIRLLYKHVLGYDADNKLSNKTVYNAEGVLRSKIHYEYDSRNNITKILDSNYHNNKFTLEYITQYYYNTQPSYNFHHLLKPDIGLMGYKSRDEMIFE